MISASDSSTTLIYSTCTRTCQILTLVLVLILCARCTTSQSAPKTDAELQTEFSQMSIAPPADADLSHIPANLSDRLNRCVQMISIFKTANPDWAVVAAQLTHPSTSERVAHMFAERGDVVFDGVYSTFFDREKYYVFFKIENMTYFWEH